MNNNTEQPLNSDIYYCPENDAVVENVIVEDIAQLSLRILHNLTTKWKNENENEKDNDITAYS